MLPIEHVMPQTLNDEWKNYLTDETLENYDVLVTKLGNLALTNYNSEMSNNSLEEKQKIYKESNFYNARGLTENKSGQLWKLIGALRRWLRRHLRFGSFLRNTSL